MRRHPRRVRATIVTRFAAALVATAWLSSVPASAAILVEIDKSTQRMTVSQDGRPLYTWPVSTGKRGHSTPSGQFKAFRMEKDHFSREWDDAPMPHSIFFTKQGHAIHGTYDLKRLGSPASHGCVRLAPEHAAILFRMVQADGVLNTQVVLAGVEPAPSQQNAPVARGAPQYQNPYANNAARNAPANDGLDRQAYGERGYGVPGPRYQQRPPFDDQRYAYEQAPPPSYYRQPQPYGRPYYPQPNYQQPYYPQPYYGSRYRDPAYDNPPPAYYQRGYGWN